MLKATCDYVRIGRQSPMGSFYVELYFGPGDKPIGTITQLRQRFPILVNAVNRTDRGCLRYAVSSDDDVVTINASLMAYAF
jgi:hypothetical protein